MFKKKHKIVEVAFGTKQNAGQMFGIDNYGIPYIWSSEFQEWNSLVADIEPICFCDFKTKEV